MLMRFYRHEFLGSACLALRGNAHDRLERITLIGQHETLPEDWQETSGFAEEIIEALDGYFTHGIALPDDRHLIPEAPSFTRACWQVLTKIPYGETISYRELAARAGNANAVRAAGTACGRNPLPLLIPCHRVIGNQGGLGGFAWGIAFKQRLLALESHAELAMAG